MSIPEIGIIEAKLDEHKRRLDEIYRLTLESDKRLNALMIVTEKHSNQLSMLMKVIYGALGIAGTALIHSIIAGHLK